tara:strand:+ start:4293 stop:4529 length:237 start_codon:yes stop_codon:yes gene_type:complete
MRRILKRVLFGKRKNYSYKNNNYQIKNLKDLIFSNNRRLNDLEKQLGNTLRALNLERIAQSNIIANKKDAEKYDNQWN